MSRIIDTYPSEIVRLARRIGRTARAMGARAYFVGGMVRDALLGRAVRDVDVVVEGDALALARRVSDDLGVTFRFFPRFGTASTVWRGRTLDLVTARREVYPRPGALPVVRPSSLKDDLFRRDFTINAMAVGIDGEDFGRLVDFFEGQDDLNRGKIRVLHDRSFQDDPTRIWRAARFEARLCFRLERRTLAWLKQALRDNASRYVTPQRCFAEFRKIFDEEDPVGPIVRLRSLGEVLPGVSAGRLFRMRRLRRCQDQCPASLRPLMFLMAFWEDVGLGEDVALMRQWGLTRKEQKTLLKIPGVSGMIDKLRQGGWTPGGVYEMLRDYEEELLWYAWLSRCHQRGAEAVGRFLTEWRAVKPALSGKDLRDLGVPSRRIGEVLRRLTQARLDGRVSDRRSHQRQWVRARREDALWTGW